MDTLASKRGQEFLDKVPHFLQQINETLGGIEVHLSNIHGVLEDLNQTYQIVQGDEVKRIRQKYQKAETNGKD